MPTITISVIPLLLLVVLSAPLGASQPGIAASLVAASVAPRAAASDWPWWRGPQRDGVSSDTTAPTSWTTSENVVWKSAVPGRGHASPVVCGERIFIATADDDAQEQRLLCYDRATGRELWNTLIHSGGFMKMHPKNSHASPTPACDGEHVYVPFINGDAQWLTAVDMSGKIAWQQKIGPFNSEHGDGPSPVLYKDLVILNGDGLGNSYIAALDRATGKIVWNTPREGAGRHANYGGPLVAEVAGRMQLLLAGHGRTFSYDPDTGEVLWSCEGPAEVAGNTMAVGGDLAFASAGYPERNIIAVKADGSGDVTDTHIVWRSGKAHTYVPSPVFHDGRLYVVNDQGVATCYNAADGEQLWQERLGGAFTASPVIAGSNVYAPSEEGIVHIFKTGDAFDEVAKIDMGEGIMATPAICGGKIYLRTAGNLYCIGD